MRETYVRPLGLITQPNQLGQYPVGAMSSARSLVVRAPGLLVPRRTLQFVSSYGPTVVSQVWSGGGSTGGGQRLYVRLRLSGPDLGVVLWESAGVFTDATLVSPFAGMHEMFLGSTQDTRFTVMPFRNRVFLTTRNDVLVGDYNNPTTTAERTFRYAQLPQPYFRLNATPVSGGLGAPSGSCTCYAAVVRRVYADGYELMSPPTVIYRFAAIGTGFDVSAFVQTYPEMKAGDIVELYKSQYVVGGAASDPGTSLYLCGSVTLDVDSNSALVPDTSEGGRVGQSFGGLGKALYTNPGQVGQEGINLAPPAARFCASYKGRAFYANYLTPGSVSLAFRGGIGAYQASASLWNRQSGVGFRYFESGTYTNGSPTLTAVPASQIAGVVPGQIAFIYSGSMLNGNGTVVSVGASTITFNKNFTASGSLSPANRIAIADVIEVNGTDVRYVWAADVLTSMSTEFFIQSARTIVSGSNELSVPDQELFIAWQRDPTRSFTLRATNGDNYDPPLPEITSTSIDASDNITILAGEAAKVFAPREHKNGLRWSKDQQPEAVPPTNEMFVGRGEIYGMYSTRDALWIFASDGLWRLSGTMARVGQNIDVRLDPVDSTLFLSGPRAACVLRDSVYAYTNRGLVRVDDLGVKELSEKIVGDLMPGQPWSNTSQLAVCADEVNDDVYVFFRTLVSEVTVIYVYSTRYDIFTNVTEDASANYGNMGIPVWDNSMRDMLTMTNRTDLVSTHFSGSQYRIANPSTNYEGFSMVLQPVYGEDPMSTKQWIDLAVIASNAGGTFTGTIACYFNTDSTPYNAQGTSYGNDRRYNVPVPRHAAVGNTMRFAVTTSTSPNLVAIKGVSFRFVEFSEQQVVR